MKNVYQNFFRHARGNLSPLFFIQSKSKRKIERERERERERDTEKTWKRAKG
jgi:hypothetical protein